MSVIDETNFKLRYLQVSDYYHGFLELLSQLTQVGNIPYAAFVERINQLGIDYYCLVIEDEVNKRIIGTATMFIEHKFIHNLCDVGHIEDVVVCDDYRGKKLGYRLISELKNIAVNRKLYKVILDCNVNNINFYEKCGFSQKESQMVLYIK